MKNKLTQALVLAACLRWQISPIHALQMLRANVDPVVKASQEQTTSASSIATGRIDGVLKDPSGAVVQGASVEIRSIATGYKEPSVTDSQGRFAFAAIPAGRYRITIRAKGFSVAVFRNIDVASGVQTSVNVSLRLARVSTSVTVESQNAAATLHTVNQNDREQARNSAELLSGFPGVSLRGNGQLASVPLLHGLGDERIRLVVNGMTISNSCPNHMNPPLSYIAPSNVSQVTVMAGITPVSMGGDSLGGTISVESRPPVFAAPGERLYEQGSFSGFYRSNGQNYGGSLSEWIAGRNLGIGYTGSWSTAGDYTDGSDRTITSTYAQTTDHTVTLAAQGKGNLFVLRAGLHHTPYQGFVNARMDMMRNYATSLNLEYRRSFAYGALDAHAFWQSTSHTMNIGHDKSTFPMPMFMPMNDHGTDLGYSVKYEVPFSERHLLRIGNELHRFVFNDSWPPVAGMAPSMGPNTFVDINNGRRTRLGTYAELVSKWNPQWTTLIGARNDTVWSNADPVHGYSDMYAADATAFNASDRARTDIDSDATALLQYKPDPHAVFEFGYTRKTRAPSLYERYAWSTSQTASSMIGWFGDGNYYVGNVRLKPEIAQTISGTAALRGRAWEIKATPYETHIQDYIDVNTLALIPSGMSVFAQLRFANHNAGIYGGDLSGDTALWNNSRLGKTTLSGVAGWLHGERLDTQTGLYQMMPINLRLKLDENIRGWSAGAGIEAVDRKSNVDPHRFEPQTPGYTLFNLHTSYQHKHVQMSAAVDNLFNKEYALPLGGVNLDGFLASMSMGQIKPVTGPGRSAYISATLRF